MTGVGNELMTDAADKVLKFEIFLKKLEAKNTPITGQQVKTLLSYAEVIVSGEGYLKLHLLSIALCAQAKFLGFDRHLLADGVEEIYNFEFENMKQETEMAIKTGG